MNPTLKISKQLGQQRHNIKCTTSRTRDTMTELEMCDTVIIYCGHFAARKNWDSSAEKGGFLPVTQFVVWLY